MSEAFGPVYAESYDALYQDKDYDAECRLIQRLLQAHGNGPIASLLDLGCGTGRHALPLARQGYEVVGVDRSESMLSQARREAAGVPGLTFRSGDIRTLDLMRRFDAVLMMFAVLGYQLENTDVLASLGTARRHLPSQGLFLFDVWYGPAVLRQRPSPRMKTIPTPRGHILRAATGELDVRRHLCTVHYHVRRLEGERTAAETRESHPMRYFFPLELELFLECSGFTLLHLGAFPEFDRDPDETTWNVLGVARAA